jgi:3-deoxy-7-phosphoheptulonate synthase
MSTWTPDSWRDHDAQQKPEWPDSDALQHSVKKLRALPPLVFAGEARNLQAELALAAEGKAFVLQAGDCAETFEGFSADRVRDALKVILQLSVVLTYSSGVPVVKIGRVAGQFAKPRSSPTERSGDLELPTYRGDMVNRVNFSHAARTPDPDNMVQAYQQAAATLNLLRAFTRGGFADLASVHAWNREFVSTSSAGVRYEAIAAGIDSALRFMAACKIDTGRVSALHEVDLYTSHEALLLDYEEALTRQDSTSGNDWYDCSAHMLWIGTRTKQLDGAHVEFLSGVHNPIGCKIGQELPPEAVVALCEKLNPNRVPGRLTLISRMGRENVRNYLPRIVEAVTSARHPVVWMCDPMHGNTINSADGLKTRRFDDIFAEIEAFFAVHRDLGTWPGGIHLELTGDNVTECLGGSDDLVDGDLALHYDTACDPRLNARQSLDLAFRVAELLSDR